MTEVNMTPVQGAEIDESFVKRNVVKVISKRSPNLDYRVLEKEEIDVRQYKDNHVFIEASFSYKGMGKVVGIVALSLKEAQKNEIVQMIADQYENTRARKINEYENNK